MNHYTIISLLVAALLLVQPGAVRADDQALPAQDASRGPNVVMIVGDDMGWTDYGFMGHDSIRTPRLDKLAAEGAVFPNGYVPTSLCRASLATLLTGQYAHRHKICCNDPPDGVARSAMLPFLREAPTIPRLLKEGAGYHSLQTGKFWEGHFSNGGFTEGMTTKGRHGEEGLAIGRQTMEPLFNFLDARAEDRAPFFVWYAPMMPHLPHNPPRRILEHYLEEGRDPRVAKYFAMCEWFDETCGQLLDHLDQKGLRQDTLVIYVADNGWVQSTGPERPGDQFATRSKLSPYDAGLRTPVILHWPGRVKPGRYDDLVSTIDLAPTILAACGLQKPPAMEGLDLMRVAGEHVKKLDRDAVFGEIFLHTCVELDKPVLSLTHRWVRAGKWKLIEPVDEAASVELYDIASDPFEQSNLAADQPDRTTALRARLADWWGRND